MIYANLCGYLLGAVIAFTGFEQQFHIVKENASTQGIQYDYESVMQFHGTAFTKNNHRTIVRLNYVGDWRFPIQFPTLLDLHHLNILYCGGM